MLSHRQMYYGLQKAFPLVNIISEEDDVEEIDMSKIAQASISNSEVDQIIPDSEDIILPAKVFRVFFNTILMIYIRCISLFLIKGYETLKH